MDIGPAESYLEAAASPELSLLSPLSDQGFGAQPLPPDALAFFEDFRRDSREGSSPVGTLECEVSVASGFGLPHAGIERDPSWGLGCQAGSIQLVGQGPRSNSLGIAGASPCLDHWCSCTRLCMPPECSQSQCLQALQVCLAKSAESHHMLREHFR